MLSKLQLENICMCNAKDSRTCKYLADDDVVFGRYYCFKQRPVEKANIDTILNKYIKDCESKGTDPFDSNIPLGDNCAGYPVLKYIEQGYDKD